MAITLVSALMSGKLMFDVVISFLASCGNYFRVSVGVGRAVLQRRLFVYLVVVYCIAATLVPALTFAV